jgi:hypothetical protein
MTLADDIRSEFAHLHESAQASDAEIAAVEAALDKLPPAEADRVCTNLGIETTNKRGAAVVIATAQKIWTAVAPVLAMAAL